MRSTSSGEAGQALEDPRAKGGVVLTPGDLLMINNRTAVHGRSFFVPRYDGENRWLQRTYLRKDLWTGRDAASADNFRVFDLEA